MSKKSDKKEQVAIKPLLGRVTTNVKMGIVGLPNVGKSTFFNVLTKSQADAANYPFCTIDPNEARVAIPDSRFDDLCQKYKPDKRIPSFLSVVDIAGLVKGAHEGEGLGNAFLSHIRACDGIFHMVRIFDSEEITHYYETVDPIRDIEIIREELRLKDLEMCKRALEDAEKKAYRATDKRLKDELIIVQKFYDQLQKGWIWNGVWNDREIELLNKHLFITSKPSVYLLNMSERDYLRQRNSNLPKIKEWIDKNDVRAPIIPFSAEYEMNVMNQPIPPNPTPSGDNEKKDKSVLKRIILSGQKALRLIYFFTVGKDEVKCWNIREGTKAPQAAGRIHSDFERGFIMAEVMTYEALKRCGNEVAVKAEGAYRQQGKLYVVQDGDIILFKFNAGAGLSGGKK
ncbi:hypothetical protein SNEBB_011033 [Seison nebaliae]|nr:hypothetical protein SNEBB_011033 [Seison nebaliae]